MPKDETWTTDGLPRRDILLVTAKLGTILIRVVLALAMALIGIVAAITVINGGVPPETIKIVVAGAARNDVTGAVLVVLLFTMVSLTLAYDFVTRLAQIIDTVGQGDPFTAANAGRLSRMAWTAIAIQLVELPAMLLSEWLKPQLVEGTFSVTTDFSLTGIGLALVLFILARVFRKGAEMRDDLEGTV
ncbi:MAG: DUF2975 domain-containing protein [Candidatus Andeanibacterium colombiense]|uniref:DUF2975 domain-containing protein n=1 Tax=Candidatus Andeanibacterium colombiense TaxID=3121345 RepID=A0AAJ5X703_9SPHN|nr:MAG: DUF2975 domain-containing protein [Sphingomonadaceae bacterium]